MRSLLIKQTSQHDAKCYLTSSLFRVAISLPSHSLCSFVIQSPESASRARTRSSPVSAKPRQDSRPTHAPLSQIFRARCLHGERGTADLSSWAASSDFGARRNQITMNASASRWLNGKRRANMACRIHHVASPAAASRSQARVIPKRLATFPAPAQRSITDLLPSHSTSASRSSRSALLDSTR